MRDIAVLVLAAGKASRMKSIKQLEIIDNKTLLDISLEKIKSIIPDTIFCVLGANSDTIKQGIKTKNIRFIINKKFETGLSSSIVAGIRYFKEKQLSFEGVFIILADQPAIEITYLKNMIELFEKNNDTIIASNYGNRLGVPAIFSVKNFKDLLLIKGDKGAKEFINKRKAEVLFPQTATNLFDIDTKEDLFHFKNLNLK